MKTELKTLAEIERMRLPARAAAVTLQRLKLAIEEGERSTLKLDRLAEETLHSLGANPAFKGYKPPFGQVAYLHTICTSVNQEVVHTPPGAKLKDGDIVSLDMGAEINGWYSDIAITVPVGDVDQASLNLLKATQDALASGIQQAIVGNSPVHISQRFTVVADLWGVSPVHDLSGHGIGRSIHEGPSIPNHAYLPAFGENKFREGVVICIEPMFCLGSGRVEQDGEWTIRTSDSSRAAHFEHVVAITNDGPKVLSDIDGEF